VRVRLPVVSMVLGLGVLAAIGIGKLVSEHRKARLEDAFGMLTAGVQRLNNADAAGALKQFDGSIEAFQDAGRDPVLALHHALAARLRSHTPQPHEVRELFLPHAPEAERSLALALSDDSALLAVATTHRLLCLQFANSRWAEWALPEPIKRAETLHVDSVTGKTNVVVGDDGRLLTADCRASGSSLIATPSITDDRAAVAWVDGDEYRVWAAPASPEDSEVKISARPLPGARGKPAEMRVSFPGEANAIFSQAVVHSIAKVGENILLFYGDSRLTHDSDLRDESVLVISIDDPERQTNRLVFPALAEEEGGKVHWRTTRVRRLLPGSAPGRVYVLTESPQGVAVLGADAKPITVHSDSLYSTEYHDGREIYDLSVKSSGGVAAMEVSRRNAGPHLNYQLPWRFRNQPRLAAISPEGRHVVVANVAGRILLVDLSKSEAL
jgi:hypothetical protein